MAYLKFQNWFKLKKAQLYTTLIHSDFGDIGKGTLIYPSFHSNNVSEVYVGANCQIHAGGWIDIIPEYCNVKHDGRIDIGDGTYIGHRVHIIACRHMTIGKGVLIADNVYISDLFHGFENIDLPILTTPLVSPGPVVIEDQVWLGERVCIMPNVRIGKHSVIGANAVVTKDIPPYSVVVGIPAKVIKQFNHSTGRWEKV
ncbi:MAG: acyltransferase [Sedimentisphaerales bacterium]